MAIQKSRMNINGKADSSAPRFDKKHQGFKVSARHSSCIFVVGQGGSVESVHAVTHPQHTESELFSS
eukprot:scaffold19292_cov28-Prasinocladus_malaysianus.AAC.1